MWVDCTRLHLQFRCDHVMLSIFIFLLLHFQMFIWLCGRTTLEPAKKRKVNDGRRGRTMKKKKTSPTHNIVKCIWRQQPLMEHEKYLFCAIGIGINARHTQTHTLTALWSNYLWRRLASSSSCFYRSIFFDFTAHFRLLLGTPSAQKRPVRQKTETIWVERTLWKRRSPHQPAQWRNEQRTNRDVTACRIETSKLPKHNQEC